MQVPNDSPQDEFGQPPSSDTTTTASMTQEQALIILVACKPLIAKFNAGGAMQVLTPPEELLVEQFHQAEEAGWVGENARDDTVRMRADMLRSDVGNLSYAYGLLLQRRDPKGTLAEVKARLADYAQGRRRAKQAPRN